MAKRRLEWRRILISLIVVASLGMIAFGFALAQTGDSNLQVEDPAVERTIPNPGSLILRQSTVGVDLAPGYRGVLVIDGQEIPTYDVVGGEENATGSVFDAQFDAAQNTVLYTPREGSTIERFSPGEHRVTAVFWKIGESRDSARSVTWTFKVS
jgi:hypothetical protein